MVFKGKREYFLSNNETKHGFITLFQNHLERQGCHTEQATADADLLIVQTDIAASENVSNTYLPSSASTPNAHIETYTFDQSQSMGKTSTQVLEYCFAQNSDSSGSVQQCVVYACYPWV